MKVVFDIGGTSMRAANATPGGIGEIRKIKTPQEPKEGLAALAALARECAGGGQLEAAAGGFPGIVADGVVYLAPNLPTWNGTKLASELTKAIGVSVTVQNDGDLAALGEASRGGGKGFRVVAYAGIGTGVGCGRVVDGRIDSGAYDFEAGHQIVDAAGGMELEALVSGRAFEKRFGVHPKDAPRAGYEEMTPILAVGLYNMILHWSPEVFVLGGSMMNEDNGYRLADITAALGRLPQIYPRLPEVRVAVLKDTAGLYGARTLLDS